MLRYVNPAYLSRSKMAANNDISPYYAPRATVGNLYTCGGIKIDEHMQVIDKQGNPIRGLCAAGEKTGG